MISVDKAIVDTRTALKNGVTKETILTEAEKFFDKQYHSFHEDWDYDIYPYLYKSDRRTISGISASGIEKYEELTCKIIDWYDIPGNKISENQQALTKIFKDDQKFNKELI